MFPGFKSLCITPYYYRYSKKLIIWANNILTSSSPTLFLHVSFTKSSKVPFIACSKTKYKLLESLNVERSFIIVGCYKELSSSFSLKICLSLPKEDTCSILTDFIATVIPVAFSFARFTTP
jgi:hypothetical protein